MYDITFMYRPGMLINQLNTFLDEISVIKPDVVLIDIGGNDVDNGRIPVKNMAMQLFDFCKSLQRVCGVKVVVVMEVTFRNRVCKGTWADAQMLNKAIRDFNSACKSLCGTRKDQQSTIRFCHHAGMVLDWQQYVHRDGVHLNEAGMGKYVKSIRSAIIRYGSLAKRSKV
jgi:lysophospholipase L1-like esterase